MARMHSRKKGKSGSHKPLDKQKSGWIRYGAKEIEMLIAKFAKDDKTASEIGIILRDVYGVPDVKAITNKSVTKILREKKLSKELPEDLIALMRKLVAITAHISNNKQDMSAKRGYQLTDSKIKRLIKYYKESGRIPVSWKYDPSKLKMYTE
ncbi:30S ribosomal protein S15 [Candidatus Woesearchaeota archaeon]|nr:30S ribosomal protein S15 [Candidatus Woesearchaeota archaeon]MBW2978821.1 30S ribosomal protein S15 [Candidatus Woesearchaeota archaeon]